MRLGSILEDILREYSEGTLNKIKAHFKKQKASLNDIDIVNAAKAFEKVKDRIKKEVEAGRLELSKRFTEKDPSSGKNPPDYKDIFNYSWKELEDLLDKFPQSKGEKEKQDKELKGQGFHTVEDAHIVDVQGAPKVYAGNGIVVYEAATHAACVKLNYAFKYKGEDQKIYTYTFCIGRIEQNINKYYHYRMGGSGNTFVSFYYVADPTQSAEIKGNPESRENFVNWYHFFVIHAYENGMFGVTDGVNVYGKGHEENGQSRGKPNQGVPWEDIGKYMVANGGESGKIAWDKIKELKEVFKYIPPSEEESDIAFVQNRRLDLEGFNRLNPNQKRIYVGNNAKDPNAFTQEMFASCDKILKGLALNSGYNASYDEIKDSPALIRTYVRYKFSRSITGYEEAKQNSKGRNVDIKNLGILPLPFVKYLSEDDKKKYLEVLGKETTNFQYLERYFGPEVTKEWVDEQTDTLGYMPPEAIKYISDPELKKVFEIYSKLFVNWTFKEGVNVSAEELDKMTAMPEQTIDAQLIAFPQWAQLSDTDRQVIVNLAKKVDTNEKYQEFLYALPFIVSDRNKDYILLPAKPLDKLFTDAEHYVLADMQNNIIRDLPNINDVIFKGHPFPTGCEPLNGNSKVLPADKLTINGKPLTQEPIKERWQKLAGIK